MLCSKCGQPLPEGKKFCSNCGQSVPVTPPSQSAQPQGQPQGQPQSQPQPQGQPQGQPQPQPQVPYVPAAPVEATPAPAPAKKKKRTAALVAIIAAVVLLAALAGALVYRFAFDGFGGDSDSENDTETTESKDEDKEKDADDKDADDKDADDKDADEAADKATDEDKDTDEEEADTLVGEWHTELNMAGAANEALVAEDTGMEEYITVDDFPITLVYKFNEDGTYSVYVDEDSVTDAMDGFKQDYKDGIIEYLEDLLEASGSDMTLEEALAEDDITLEDLEDEIDAQFDSLDTSEMFEGSEAEGQYKAEDGKLYVSDSVNEEPSEDSYKSYTLDGDTLTLDEGSDEVPDSMKEFVPMKFTRVKS